MQKHTVYAPIRLLLLAFLLFPLQSALAALPFAVNDQPLPTLAPMLEVATPAVVHIATQGRSAVRRSEDPVLEHFFGQRRPSTRRTRGLGSGVVFNAEKGYIVTNGHVVEDTDNIKVTLKDGRSFDATVVGTDPDADVAIIQIKASGLTAIPLADSSNLRVGDFVVAIGNPFGLSQTATSGIVSALGRHDLGIESYEDFIQTDASINPGNSGGALVNLRGELVGINTAILGPSGGNIGIGFAIPINMVKGISDQLIEFGEVRRGRLGIGIQDLTPELARAFNIQGKRGAVVAQVEQGSAADRAGIEPGDVVTRVNGVPVDDASALRTRVGLLRIGTEVEMEIIRKGETQIVKASLEAPVMQKVTRHGFGKSLEGAMLESVSIDGDAAVLVASIESGSTADRAGLSEGDIILSVNRQSVSDVEEVVEAIKLSDKSLLLNIIRDGRGLFLLLQ